MYPFSDTYLSHLILGVTSLTPVPETHGGNRPALPDFSLCGFNQGVVPAASAATVTCLHGGAMGRHVVVMVDDDGYDNVLAVCEITARGCE